MKFQLWTQQYHDQSYAYLDKHIETSMFILQNLKEHGPFKGEHQNSGNFYQVIENDKVIGIFVLANRGNVLLQVDKKVSLEEIYIFLKRNEKTKMIGVLGDNALTERFWEIIKTNNKNLIEKFRSAEFLYKIDLKIKELQDIKEGGIFPQDQFDLYNKFSDGFYADQGLPDYSTMDQRRERFQYNVNEKQLWALWKEDQIVSTCNLNARYKNLAQVGGVYTPKKYRRKGYSKLCMQKLLFDCKYQHALDKVILFTGDKNTPAQKVYEAIGFEKIGRYGMYFGQEEL